MAADKSKAPKPTTTPVNRPPRITERPTDPGKRGADQSSNRGGKGGNKRK